MNIYVGNLSQETSETKLRDLFATYGEVETAKIITDSLTGLSRGFGFVEMSSKKEGEKAIDELNSTVFESSTIVVNEARKKPTHSGEGNFKFNKRSY